MGKFNVVIINGSGESGKDTFISKVNQVSFGRMKVFNISSIDVYKNIAKQLGWSGQKDDKSRKFLSDLKKLSSEYNSYPIKWMLEELELLTAFSILNDIVVFIHIREPKEIEESVKTIKDNFEDVNVKTLLVVNNNVAAIDTNDSDRLVRDYEYDYVIDNSGSLDDLKETAREWFDGFMEVKI